MKSIYATQTNTLAGIIVLAALAANCQTEGHVAMLGSTGLADPTAVTDRALFLVLDRGEDDATVFPLTEGGENCRIRLNGTCSKGDVLVLAAGGDLGKVTKLDAQTGKLFSVGIAEEDGVDEQLVLVRPMPRYLTGEAGAIAFTGATPVATAAALTSYGFTEAQANALVANVREMRAALIAHGIMATNA
ncbi:MAG: hypothetical protein Q8Q59_06365 [Luteolibacter sp.]|jgi:hypothetical protein|nr:hypothetical protein [Luteolibacter sp.]